MGRQGAGKGTQAILLASAFGVPHIATGDLLRDIASADDGLGRRVAAAQAAGRFADAADVLEALVRRISASDARAGMVLDGFPRRAEQVDELDRVLAPRTVTAAVLLDIGERCALKRLAARRVCIRCGAIYAASALPEGMCLTCGAPARARQDDLNPEAVARRLGDFRRLTERAIERYARQGRLERANGDRPVAAVHSDVLGRLRARSVLAPTDT